MKLSNKLSQLKANSQITKIVKEAKTSVNDSITCDDVNQEFFYKIKEKLSPILNRVISNLIKSRDYLGLQLNFEFGNISNEQYEQLEMDFLTETEAFLPDVLKEDINMIMKLSNRVYNAEEISTMFHCSLEIAEESIGLVLIDKAE